MHLQKGSFVIVHNLCALIHYYWVHFSLRSSVVIDYVYLYYFVTIKSENLIFRLSKLRILELRENHLKTMPK